MVVNPFVLGAALSICCAAAGGAATAGADTFQVVLAGSALGTLTYETAPGDGDRPAALRTDMDNTPLGVFDGSWETTSRPARTEAGDLVLQYLSTTASARKNRVISILHADGHVLQTTVEPIHDATELSQADQVPAGVHDPVEAFGQIVSASGCPEPFRIYDGRRVVEVSTTGTGQGDGTLTCQVNFRIVAGPGILSPFRFNSFDAVLTYDVTGGAARLIEANVSAGIFAVQLVRSGG